MTDPDTDLRRADFEPCFDDQPAPADPYVDLERGRGARRARTQRRVAAAVATLTLVAAVLVAAPRWGGPPQQAVPAAPPDLVQQSWPGCAAAGAFDQEMVSGPPPQAGAVPTDFRAVEVRRCVQDSRRSDKGDQVLVNLEQRAPATAAFLAYLAQPSVTPTDPSLACPAIGIIRPWLVLVDGDGRYVAPALPTDECGLPLQYNEVGGAPDNLLKFRDVSVDQERVLESAAAQQAGCSMEAKNMLFFDAGQSPQDVDRGLLGGAAFRRCDYRINRDTPDSGTFVAGGALSAAELTDLLARAKTVAASGQARCAKAANQFTVVHGTDDQHTLYVETDGCHRVLQLS